MNLEPVLSSFTGEGQKGAAGLEWGVSLRDMVTEPFPLQVNSRMT